MKLDFINKEIENGKNFIKDFIEELTEAVEKNNEKNEIKQNSIFEQFQIDKKITTEYRDKMRLERNSILNEYAKLTLEKGDMYYIYAKNSTKENTYNLCLCKSGESNKVIEVNENDLPKNAGVDSILRISNGKYVLDKEATSQIENQLNNRFKELVEEQNIELEKNRTEDHVYEIADIAGDRIWLEDKTINLGICFEETVFSKEELKNFSLGDLFVFQNGKYTEYSK